MKGNMSQGKFLIGIPLMLALALLLAFPGAIAAVESASNDSTVVKTQLFKPDLVITGVSTEAAKGGGYKVKYTILNIGTGTAPAGHVTRLYVDGQVKSQHQVTSNLRSRATLTFTFPTVITCSGTSDAIKVCADTNNVVDESNEGNNCKTITYTCLRILLKPDLVITGVWPQPVTGGYRVKYAVKNIGTATAPAGHWTDIYIDGQLKAGLQFKSDLDPGATLTYTWPTVITCTGTSDSIKVCADADERVAELNEGNNCKTITYTCPAVAKPDLVIQTITIMEEAVGGGYKVKYVVKNVGTARAPEGHDATLSVEGIVIEEQRVGIDLGAGGTSYIGTFESFIMCRGESDEIKVCADINNEVDELNEGNNCKTITYTCPPVVGKPDLEITGVWTEAVTGGYRVKYEVKNIGTGTAVALAGHDAGLAVDGQVIETQPVGATLESGAIYNGIFVTVITCTGTSDAILVCADTDEEVAELNEGNNCRTKTYSCALVEKPDLVIDNMWKEAVAGGYIVKYVLKNIGTDTAPWGHDAGLAVDGQEIERQSTGATLDPGATYNGIFVTVITCTGTSDAIKVCADTYNEVDEVDEENNCRTSTYSCAVVEKPDLMIEGIWQDEVDGGYMVRYQVKNIGTTTAPWGHDMALYVDGQVIERQSVDATLDPGGSYMTRFKVIECSGTSDEIKVCADTYNELDEVDEGNNCRTYTYSCPGLAEPTVSIQPVSQEVSSGGSFIVSIHVDTAGKGASSGSMEVSFNAEVMQVDKVEPGDLLGSSPIIPPGFPKIDNVAGTVVIDLARTGAVTPPTPPGDFAKITVTAKVGAPEGMYPVNLTKAELLDENFTAIPIITGDGSVKIIKVSYPRWDINQDGTVDYKDLAILGAHWEETTTPPYPSWDMNQDGTIDYKDLAMLAAHYGETS